MNRASRDGSLVYEYASLLERAGRLADAERAFATYSRKILRMPTR